MEQSLSEHLSKIEDPRVDRTKLHKLVDILIMSILATIGGAEGWSDIELFCKSKQEWLGKLLSLENGIPSDDTFRRVISKICPETFQTAILQWMESVQSLTKGQINVDGKKLRSSFEESNRRTALHLVQAWSVENHLCLGQLESEGKSNEIKTLPKLLEMLDISGCIVSIDAMGTQKDIAYQIIKQEGDYVLALKANQRSSYEEVTEFFEDQFQSQFQGISHDYWETTDGDHGRIEIRKYWITTDIQWMRTKVQWKGLQSIGMVESTRIIGGNQTTERRYFLTSLPQNAQLFAKTVRNHWRIENSLHWVLDVVFREDESRIRKDHGPENFSWLRKFALSMLKKAHGKGSIRAKRKKAGWDHQFLESILTNF